MVRLNGQLAQLVEQRIENPRVRGSIPRLATNFKSPNSFRAFSRLPCAPVLAGLRGFASRAAPLPFLLFRPSLTSLFSVFIWWSRERARGHFQYWRGFGGGELWLGSGCLRRLKHEISPNHLPWKLALAVSCARQWAFKWLLDSETCRMIYFWRSATAAVGVGDRQRQ